MAFLKKRNYKRGRKVYRRRAAKRMPKRFHSKAFTKAVQRIVHKDAETKQMYNSIQDVAFNSAINSVGDLQIIIPNNTQGASDNTRIGDVIRAQKLKIKGFLNTRFSYGTNTYYQACRIGVRLMVVQPKAYTGLLAIQNYATTWLGGLLKKGGTTTGFTGTQSDLMADINTDAITCYYDKVFYVQQPWANTTVGSAGTSPLMPVNSVKFFQKTFNLKNKLLKYDFNENNGLTPTNFNPVVIMGYCLLDGSADSVNTAVALSYDSYLYFEDV